MAAVTATLEAIENDRMLENVRSVESYLRKRLKEVEQVVNIRDGRTAFCDPRSPAKDGTSDGRGAGGRKGNPSSPLSGKSTNEASTSQDTQAYVSRRRGWEEVEEV